MAERGVKRNGGETWGEKRDGRKDQWWLIDRLEKIKGQKIDRRGRKRTEAKRGREKRYMPEG